MWGPKRLYNSVSLLERCSVWVCDLGEGSVHLRMSLWGLVVSVCWREWLSLPLSVTRQWRGLAQMLEPNVRIHHGRDLGPVSKARRASVTLSIIVICQSVVMRIKHSNVCQVFSAVAGTS